MTIPTAQIGLSYPKPRELLTKIFKISRSDTTGTKKAALPKSAYILGAYVIGGTASDAATSATISFGSSATATEYVSGYDVKTAATGEGYSAVGAAAVGSAFGTALASDVTIYGIYAESGTASTTGGPWIVKLEYFVPGPGEAVDD